MIVHTIPHIIANEMSFHFGAPFINGPVKKSKSNFVYVSPDAKIRAKVKRRAALYENIYPNFQHIFHSILYQLQW